MADETNVVMISTLIDQGVIVAHKDGNYGSNYPRTDEFGVVGVPLLTAKLVSDSGEISFADAPRLRTDKAEMLTYGFIQSDDVLLSHNATVGRVALVPKLSERVLVGTSLTYFRTDPQRLLPRYLAAYFKGRDFQNQLRAVMSHSTRNQVPITAQRQLSIVVPPLAEQRTIAAVLGSLDDKIELNRRMNRTLEQMAVAIFKAWFVDFEPVRAKASGAASFPGMPQPVFDALPATFADSELGPIPEGWEVGCIGDIGANRRDGVQPSEIDPETPYIGLEHMPRQCIALDTWERANKVTSGKSAFSRGEVLFGKLRPYFHKVGIAPIDGVCSTDVLVVRPRAACWAALLLGHLSSLDFVNHTDACSSGTKMPRTNWTDMARYPIAVPPKAIATEANRLTGPMVEQILLNIHESRSLAETRDALLPKLLSGEVRFVNLSNALDLKLVSPSLDQIVAMARLADELELAPAPKWPEPKCNGSRQAVMPVLDNGPAIERFERQAYEHGFVIDFDWTGWQDQAGQYFSDPARLANADVHTIQRLVTTCVRKERFFEGTLASLHAQGILAAICRRLGQLAKESSK